MNIPTEEQAKEAANILREFENLDNRTQKLIEQCTGHKSPFRDTALTDIIKEYAIHRLINPQ